MLDVIKPLPYSFIRSAANSARKMWIPSKKRFCLDFKLLTPPTGNLKLSKNSLPTYGLSLAPHTLSGYNVCPKATKECSDSCLGKISGRSKLTSVQQSRIKKTRLLVKEPEVFISQLLHELYKCNKKHGFDNWAFRSNVVSDINWSLLIPEIYDFTKFNYDYTKRMDIFNAKNERLHITFSYSGYNTADCISVLDRGGNVAVVCKNKQQVLDYGCFTFPNDNQYRLFPVVDGDIHDQRYLDPPGSVVLLKPKGKVVDSPFLVTMENIPILSAMKNFKIKYGNWIEVANDQTSEEYFKKAIEENKVWTVFQDNDSYVARIVSGFFTHNHGSGYVISDKPYNKGEWIDYDW
jgi:hypothetical protein